MIEILRPGLLTTIQDGGRRGFQAFGVPVCGAMDWNSLAVANILAGNVWDEAALEVTALGPMIRFCRDAVFALAGADFSAQLNGAPLPANSAFLAHEGDILELNAAKGGFRTYLAVSGGFDIPVFLASRSTCLSAHFGGFEGRALRKGDKIPLREPQLWQKGLPKRFYEPVPSEQQSIRVVLGPQHEAFSEEGLDTFFHTEYKLGKDCDRMGCRLEGHAISLRDGVTPNILSDGVAMGSIQVPNGQPIVMMADRQTTGGYVKLGAVITADLPILAQKRPGDTVCFTCVSMQEAHTALHRSRRKLRALEAEWNRGDLW